MLAPFVLVPPCWLLTTLYGPLLCPIGSPVLSQHRFPIRNIVLALIGIALFPIRSLALANRGQDLFPIRSIVLATIGIQPFPIRNPVLAIRGQDLFPIGSIVLAVILWGYTWKPVGVGER